MYTQHEALARERMLEQRANAAHRRLTHEMASARRWQWLAKFTASRAARSQRRLSEMATNDYTLVG